MSHPIWGHSQNWTVFYGTLCSSSRNTAGEPLTETLWDHSAFFDDFKLKTQITTSIFCCLLACLLAWEGHFFFFSLFLISLHCLFLGWPFLNTLGTTSTNMCSRDPAIAHSSLHSLLCQAHLSNLYSLFRENCPEIVGVSDVPSTTSAVGLGHCQSTNRKSGSAVSAEETDPF